MMPGMMGAAGGPLLDTFRSGLGFDYDAIGENTLCGLCRCAYLCWQLTVAAAIMCQLVARGHRIDQSAGYTNPEYTPRTMAIGSCLEPRSA
jgi:hypothetical protein